MAQRIGSYYQIIVYLIFYLSTSSLASFSLFQTLLFQL